MKPTIKWLLLLTTIVQLNWSCKKDFLETPPTTVIVRQEYVSDLKTTQDYLNGTFADMAQYLYHGYHVIYADVAADNVKPATGSTALGFQYNWAQLAKTGGGLDIDASRSEMNSLWASGYRIVHSASVVIEAADQFRNENPARADSVKSQALALRALAHFQLLSAFAQPFRFTPDASHPGVPYIKTSILPSTITRQKVSENFQNLIADMTSALPFLPATFQAKSKLLISKNAGKALLARFYLAKGDYSNAKSVAVEVCNEVPLMSIAEGYPANLFAPQTKLSEPLFQLPPEQNNFITFLPNVYYNLFSEFVATSDIAQILTENSSDIRKDWVTKAGSTWTVAKFPAITLPEISIPVISYYTCMIRSAETFLIAAESCAQLQDETNARSFLDAIRNRANPGIAPVTATGTALLDSIYKERRKELCFENIRLYDLLRTGKSIDRVDAPAGYQHLNYPSDKAVCPIPLDEVQRQGLQQNIGY